MPSSTSPATRIIKPRLARRGSARSVTPDEVVDEATLTGVSLNRLAIDGREVDRLTVKQAELVGVTATSTHLDGLVLEDVVCRDSDLDAAVRAIHDAFELGGETEAVVYAGTGR